MSLHLYVLCLVMCIQYVSKGTFLSQLSLREAHLDKLTMSASSTEATQMMLRFACPTHATELIRRGLKVDGYIYECEVVDNLKYSIWCENCQAHGHTARICTEQHRCTKCAGYHPRSKCKATFLCCVLCLGPHPITKRNCPIKMAMLLNFALSQHDEAVADSALGHLRGNLAARSQSTASTVAKAAP